MSYRLGLTGSIGMGKSTTAGFFRDWGIPVWDADAAVHRLYGVGGAGVEPIRALYPAAITEHGVSRDVLKAWIHRDATALTQIEQVVHPLVAADRQDFLNTNRTEPLVVLDIPLLFETGADGWLDGVLVVSVDAEEQRARVMARPGMTEQTLASILSRQMPDAEKRARADFVIETNTLEDTKSAVHDLIRQLTEGQNA